MSNKMRDSFTKWYSEQVQCGKAYEDELWQAWQASRAALVVELPAQWSNQCYDDEIMFSGQVIDAIDSAGVSYK